LALYRTALASKSDCPGSAQRHLDWASGEIALGFEIRPIDGRIFVPAAMASAVSSSHK
jgi:hypothetical protein